MADDDLAQKLARLYHRAANGTLTPAEKAALESLQEEADLTASDRAAAIIRERQAAGK